MNAIAMTILKIGFDILPLLIWSSGRNECDRDRLDTAGRSSDDQLMANCMMRASPDVVVIWPALALPTVTEKRFRP